MVVFQVFWGVLNITLFISLLIGLFTGFKPLRERFGVLGSILPLVLIAVMCQSQSANRRLSNNGKLEEFKTITVKHNLPAYAYHQPYFKILDDLTTCDIRQSIFLSQIHQSDSVQISSHSYLIGFVSGVVWLPIDMQVDLQPNKQVHYYTLGTLEWQLLGVPIFKQRKQFDGYITI